MELEKLCGIIAEVLSVDSREVTLDTAYIDDLGADSLDIYQIIMGIEAEFGIVISAKDTEEIRTVGETLELIKANVG